ncbi:helix-hairpin-helix domain-containing protein, partial [Frankia sp. AvcI1]
AVSIARRLQDPLAELVKIDPKSIGVGQYQHDLAEARLSSSLDAVVEDCVNAVGVDVNTASAPLLTRVSGIGAGLAENLVRHRDANGPFRTREALRDVPRLGPKAFEQCAGFLRIRGGDDPLDGSSVHPESYPVVRRILAATGGELSTLIGNGAVLRSLKPTEFVDDTVGLPTVTDILAELEKPGRDPRPAFRTAAFTEGIETLADLVPGMTLEGTVTNVAAFGAFVDVGVHQDGLVHVSAMSKNFVSDPREVAKPGDIVTVKVLDVDIPRKRISLTLRLDDEVGAPAGGAGRGSGRRGGDGGGTGSSGGNAGSSSSGGGERRAPGGGAGTGREGARRGEAGGERRDGAGGRGRGGGRDGSAGRAPGTRGGGRGGAGGPGGVGSGGGAGANRGGGGAGANRGGGGGRGGRGGAPDGAIADALRRAGIVTGDRITLDGSDRKRS